MAGIRDNATGMLIDMLDQQFLDEPPKEIAEGIYSCIQTFRHRGSFHFSCYLPPASMDPCNHIEHEKGQLEEDVRNAAKELGISLRQARTAVGQLPKWSMAGKFIPYCMCRSYVYLIFGRSDRYDHGLNTLLYVGSTIAPFARLRAHQRLAIWWEHVEAVQILGYPAPDLHTEEEKAFIRNEKPLYNVTYRRHPWEKKGGFGQA